MVQNDELRYLPNTSYKREKIKSTLAAGFFSFGLSVRPIQWLPVFRLNGGLQSGFFNSISKESDFGTENSNKWAIQNPVYSFQISAGKSILFKTGELAIEPFYQYYTGKVFVFRLGNYSMPGQLGVQISWKW